MKVSQITKRSKKIWRFKNKISFIINNYYKFYKFILYTSYLYTNTSYLYTNTSYLYTNTSYLYTNTSYLYYILAIYILILSIYILYNCTIYLSSKCKNSLVISPSVPFVKFLINSIVFDLS